jgi:hypothetical protein
MDKEENKKNKNDVPTTKNDVDILELIRLIDSNKDRLFKPYDVFYGSSIIFFLIAILYIAIEPILVLNTTSLVDKAVLVLSLVAVVSALFSLITPFVKENIIAKNFKRLELCVVTEKKPLLKSLIRMKAKNTKFDLEQIYNMNKEMFTKEKLFEKLYE